MLASSWVEVAIIIEAVLWGLVGREIRIDNDKRFSKRKISRKRIGLAPGTPNLAQVWAGVNPASIKRSLYVYLVLGLPASFSKKFLIIFLRHQLLGFLGIIFYCPQISKI
jgi:hypothetical protein